MTLTKKFLYKMLGTKFTDNMANITFALDCTSTFKKKMTCLSAKLAWLTKYQIPWHLSWNSIWLTTIITLDSVTLDTHFHWTGSHKEIAQHSSINSLTCNSFTLNPRNAYISHWLIVNHWKWNQMHPNSITQFLFKMLMD